MQQNFIVLLNWFQVSQSTHVRLGEHDISTTGDGATPEDVPIEQVTCINRNVPKSSWHFTFLIKIELLSLIVGKPKDGSF